MKKKKKRTSKLNQLTKCVRSRSDSGLNIYIIPLQLHIAENSADLANKVGHVEGGHDEDGQPFP